MDYESPNYELLMKKKDFEVRKYGFITLFSYIRSEYQERRKNEILVVIDPVSFEPVY